MKDYQSYLHALLRLFQIFRGSVIFWIFIVGWYAVHFYTTVPYGFDVQSAERQHCGILYTSYEEYTKAIATDLKCRQGRKTNFDPSLLSETVLPGDDVLVEYDTKLVDDIIEGKLVVNVDSSELASQVTRELFDKFPNDIISIKKLFPNTGLVDDLVVTYETTQRSYLDITTFLSTIVEFEDSDPVSGTNDKLVRVNPNVLFIHEPNETLDEVSRKESLISDPTFGGFGTQSTQVDLEQWYLNHIWIPYVDRCLPWWEPVKIAVVDNGFDLFHPDLDDNIYTSYDVADKDEDAQVPNYTPERNHGTKEAGIIWAEHNDIGIDGIFPHAELILIKSTKDTANGRDITNWIEWIAKAYEMWAQVINLSWWWYGNVPMLERVTKKIASEWVKIVAAAWNYNKDEKFYPAAYDRVISVSAIDQQNQKASFSNYWPRVDITAPWVNIVTTDLNMTYNVYNGTSEASPIVAWWVALAMSHGLDRTDITNNVLDIGNEYLGVGMINLRFVCDMFEEAVTQEDRSLRVHGVAHVDKVTSKGIILMLAILCCMLGVVTWIIHLISCKYQSLTHHTV